MSIIIDPHKNPQVQPHMILDGSSPLALHSSSSDMGRLIEAPQRVLADFYDNLARGDCLQPGGTYNLGFEIFRQPFAFILDLGGKKLYATEDERDGTHKMGEYDVFVPDKSKLGFGDINVVNSRAGGDKSSRSQIPFTDFLIDYLNTSIRTKNPELAVFPGEQVIRQRISSAVKSQEKMFAELGYEVAGFFTESPGGIIHRDNTKLNLLDLGESQDPGDGQNTGIQSGSSNLKPKMRIRFKQIPSPGAFGSYHRHPRFITKVEDPKTHLSYSSNPESMSKADLYMIRSFGRTSERIGLRSGTQQFQVVEYNLLPGHTLSNLEMELPHDEPYNPAKTDKYIQRHFTRKDYTLTSETDQRTTLKRI